MLSDTLKAPSRADILQFLEKGIFAPSADNLQPWQFKVSNAQADVFIDISKTESFCDEGLRMPYVSAGALIENIRIAALEKGYRLLISYFPDSHNKYWLARISFENCHPHQHSHWRVIEARTTNRRFYDSNRIIPDDIYERLYRIVDDEPTACLRVLKKDDARFEPLSRLIGKADQLRFESERLHRELMQVMRFNPKEAESTRDGLDVRALDAGPGSAGVFKAISSWRLLQTLNRLGLSRLFGNYAEKQMQSSSAAVLLTVSPDVKESYVRGGELMQRLWHETAVCGLALQPMEALPIFIINLRLNDGYDFTENQRAELTALKRQFDGMLGIDDNDALILFFRLGYSKPPSARSKRKDIESFLIR